MNRSARTAADDFVWTNRQGVVMRESCSSQPRSARAWVVEQRLQ
jgi:hypothetical protein